MGWIVRTVATVAVALAMASCGVAETSVAAGTSAKQKAKELEEGRKAMGKAEEGVGKAMETARRRNEEAMGE